MMITRESVSRRVALPFLCLLALALSLCLSPAKGDTGPGDWWMFQHDPQHTGCSSFSGPISPMKKWTYTIGIAPVCSSPAIGADSSIYVLSTDGNLYAINPNGTKQWTFHTGASGFLLDSSPAIGEDGTIYVGGADGNLYAINPDGTQQWAFPTGNYIYSSPAIGTDNSIYVVSNDGKLFAMNPDGTEQWAFNTGAPGGTLGDLLYSSPAIGEDGTIFFGDGNTLFAVNPDGTQQWLFNTGGDIDSSPAIGQYGTIYLISNSTGNNPYANLDAINPDGNELSISYNEYGYCTPVIGADGTIYSLTYQLNGGFFSSSPAIGSDGIIYIGYCGPNGNYLCAMNPDGTQKWTFPTKSYISALAIGAEGTIYCVMNNATLIAIGGAPLTALEISTSPTSAQLANIPITLTALANGGANLKYQFWLYNPSVTPAWSQLQGYSSSDSCTWTPTSVGNYLISATVKDGASNTEINVISAYTVDNPLLSMSINATPVSPHSPNTPITIKAITNGGSNMTYQFWLFTAAATPAWSQLQEFSSTATYYWTPSVPGNYLISATAKDGVTGKEVNSIIAYTVDNPLLAIALTNLPATPQLPNKQITFTAVTTGGSILQYQFWLYNPNQTPAWSQLQAYSNSATCFWTPTTEGNYLISASAKDGVTGTVITQSLWYTVSTLNALNIATTLANPQPINTSITLIAASSGGTNVTYQFWTYNPSASPAWNQLQAFSTQNTCSWSPTAPGAYLLTVTAQDGFTGLKLTKSSWYTIFIPLTGLIIAATPNSPQPANNPITIIVSATGGTNVQYQYWLYNPSGNPAWSQLQGYSSSDSCTWTPPSPGNYLIAATALDSLTGTEINKTLWYTIIGATLSAVSVSAYPASPQVAKTHITLTATATGGTSVEYQFWIYNPTASPAWSQLQSFSPAASYVWTPAVAGSYLLSVSVKDGATGLEMNTTAWYTVQ